MKFAFNTSLFFIFLYLTSYSQNSHFSVLTLPDSLVTDANSVVQFEDVSIEIKSQREMLVHVKKAITILNKLDEEYADITIHYNKRRKIKNLEAHVYDATGREIKKIKKNDFKDYSAYDGFSLYNDGRLLYYDHTPVAYPFTISYSYDIQSSNTAFIRRWVPVKSYHQSVRKAVFSIRYPLDITLRKSEKNFENFNISTTERAGILRYELKNIPAIKYEPYSPYLLNIIPNVKLGINKFNLEGVDGVADNWKEFGKWYYDNLIKNTLALPESAKSRIKTLTAGVTNPVEKARIVYEFVQNKVRYISIQVGIGGFKPMLASQVDNLGYGDCKALTNYTASLLNEVGIKSYHTLIYGSDKRDIDATVAAPEGNHMILYVPINNQDFWLECTSQKSPFSELGNFTDDRDALVIMPEGGVLKHTRVYKVEENLQYTKGSYSVDETGAISAAITIESSGTQYDDNLGKYDGKSKKELDVLFKEYLSDINNISFSEITVVNNKKDAKFEEKLVFSATDYASFSGDHMLLPLNAFNRNTYVPKRVRHRELPFEIKGSYLDIDEIEISLPETFQITYLPESVNLTSKFGTYEVHIEKTKENSFLYKRTLKIVAGNYEKEDYEAYRKFRKKVKKYDNLKMILTKQ